jgi:hypothetical protein
MVVELSTETLYEKFDEDYDIVCAVDRDYRISFCNRAWDSAALQNSAEDVLRHRQLGRSLLEAISPCLREFYAAHIRHVIDYQRPWHLFYLCSSASLLREFKMVLDPIPENGVLIRHTLIAEKPHPFPALPPSHNYFDLSGHVAMCAHCRFTERQDGSDRWDWVPDFVEIPPLHLDYVLCRLCARHFELKRSSAVAGHIF